MTHEEAMTPPFTIKTVELDDEAKEHLKRTIAGYKWHHEDDKTEIEGYTCAKCGVWSKEDRDTCTSCEWRKEKAMEDDYKWQHEDDKTESQLNDLVKEDALLSPKEYTLNEAMHLALDGAKVCHDGYVNDAMAVLYVEWSGYCYFCRWNELEGKIFYPDREDTPKSGWRIYKEPKVTYKGIVQVMAALTEGKELTSFGSYRSVELANGILTIETNDNRVMYLHLDNTFTERNE